MIDLQSQLEGLTNYESDIQDGIAWENTASSAMSNVNELTQRVRELVVEAANGTNNQSDLNTIALEVEQLTESIKQDANTQYAGQYVFSGTATTTPPYETGANDEFKGNSETVSRAVGPAGTVTISTNISTLLGNGAASEDGKLLDTLRTITQHLRGGTEEDTEALGTTDLESLDENLEQLSQLQAVAGSATDQLKAALTRNESVQTSDHRGALQHRGHEHRGRLDPVRQRAGRVRGRAARRRDHRPGIAAQLPAVAEPRRPAIMPVTFESIRFGTVEIAARGRDRVPARADRPGRPALRADRPQPRHRLSVAARGRRPGAGAAGGPPGAVLLRRSRSRSRPRTASAPASRTPPARELYVTVRATPNPLDITANLRAPLVIHEGRGYQVINIDEDAALQAPLFTLSAGVAAPSGDRDLLHNQPRC